MTDHITELQSAITTADQETIATHAHNFKSMVGYVGGRELSAVCDRLENAARHQSSDHYSDLQSQLTLESQRLQLALEQEIQALSSKIATLS